MGQKNHSFEEKLQAVNQVNAGKSIIEVGRETGAHKSNIQKWVAAYAAHGEKGLARQRRSYTGQFKQMVVEDMRENGLSCREAAAKHNISTHNVVSRWERVYLESGPEELYKERRGQADGARKGRPPKFARQIEEDLIAENQRLRAEVDYLKKLNALVQKRELQEKKPR